ncbi:MAG: hypothetical protein HYV07_14185 [Deltaproteobacteria bacterium]|nr:hypothetical protein [Deltaproteobacteria bacterium]
MDPRPALAIRVALSCSAGCFPESLDVEPPKGIVFGALYDPATQRVLWEDATLDEELHWPSAAYGQDEPVIIGVTRQALAELHPALDFEAIATTHIVSADPALERCADGRINAEWTRLRVPLPPASVLSARVALRLDLEVPIAANVCGPVLGSQPFEPGLPNRSVILGEPRDHEGDPKSEVAREFFAFVDGAALGPDRRLTSTGRVIYELDRGEPHSDARSLLTREVWISALSASSTTVIVATEAETGSALSLVELEGEELRLGPALEGTVTPPDSRGVRVIRSLAQAEGAVGAAGDRGLILFRGRGASRFQTIERTSRNLAAVAATGATDVPFIVVGDHSTAILIRSDGSSAEATPGGSFGLRSATSVRPGFVWVGAHGGALFELELSTRQWKPVRIAITPTTRCAQPDACGHLRIATGIEGLAVEPISQSTALLVDECEAVVRSDNGCVRGIDIVGRELGTVMGLEGEFSFCGYLGTLFDVPIARLR